MQKRQSYFTEAGAGISANPLILKLCALELLVLAWAWMYGSFQNLSQLIPPRWTRTLALSSTPAWRIRTAIATPALLASAAGVVAILLLARTLQCKKHNLVENMRRFSAASEQAMAIEARTSKPSDPSLADPFARGAQQRRTNVCSVSRVSE
jgi:hypothetical protein